MSNIMELTPERVLSEAHVANEAWKALTPL